MESYTCFKPLLKRIDIVADVVLANLAARKAAKRKFFERLAVLVEENAKELGSQDGHAGFACKAKAVGNGLSNTQTFHVFCLLDCVHSTFHPEQVFEIRGSTFASVFQIQLLESCDHVRRLQEPYQALPSLKK